MSGPGGVRPPLHPEGDRPWPPPLAEIVSRAWHADFRSRPEMAAIVPRLTDFVADPSSLGSTPVEEARRPRSTIIKRLARRSREAIAELSERDLWRRGARDSRPERTRRDPLDLSKARVSLG